MRTINNNWAKESDVSFSIITIFNMPFFAQTSPFDQEVEKATNEVNTSEDWSLILDICEKVGRTPNGARDCLKSIVKRLNHRVPFVTMQALTLLDACMNNCGRPFHLEISSRDFVSECRSLLSQKTHPKVVQKLKFHIKKWAEMPEFKDDPALNLIPSFYDSLKKDGIDFSDPDAGPKKGTASLDVAKEEDDIAKAIALSLKESDKKTAKGSTSLYPSSVNASSGAYASSSGPRETRKVRALYDFEAAEDNELTFKAGELISVLDDSDPNWWKGFNHRGEGLFPANFVTADLTVEPEEAKDKKSVQFNEEVEVKTVEAMPEDVDIDENKKNQCSTTGSSKAVNKIDETLQLIQNADPTGINQPDTAEMLNLEEQCKVMGPLIDTELEKIDRNHANLVDLNKKVMEALQMYHSLMKENPGYSYSMKTTQQFIPPGPMPGQMNQPGYSGQPQYVPPGPIPQGQGQIASGPVIQQNYPQPPNASQPYCSMPNQVAQTGYQTLPSETSTTPTVPQVMQNNGDPAHNVPGYNVTNNQNFNAIPQMYQPLPPQQPLL